ncbi:MAG: hypothetical protein SVW02_04250 [Candidatus Nanohaloarchaea archaeon]|nr:hypothetical protein [Candidatus Nanohaloarchaea archaeon]
MASQGSSGGKKKQVTQESHDLEEDVTAIDRILDTDKQVKRLRRNLGLVKKYERDDNGKPIPGTGEWVVEDHAPMNEKGIRNVTSFFRSIVDQNQIMSIYKDDEITRIMKEIHKTLSRELLTNWHEYGIQNRSSFDRVVEIVTDNAYSVLKRAREGETLEKVTKSTKTVTKSTSEVSPTDEGGGWAPSFLRRG